MLPATDWSDTDNYLVLRSKRDFKKKQKKKHWHRCKPVANPHVCYIILYAASMVCFAEPQVPRIRTHTLKLGCYVCLLGWYAGQQSCTMHPRQVDMMCHAERAESGWQHVPTEWPHTPSTHHWGTLGRRPPPRTNDCYTLSDTHFSSRQTDRHAL